MSSTSIDTIVDEVLGLYEKFGNADYIGEPVSQLEHMSQSAQLAIQEGYDDQVVLAAFFHDIGHICVMNNEENNMGGYGVKSHEKIGADYLRAKGFPEAVAQMVESHVQAKRYLTFKYPEYYNALSEASKKTLEYQGGPMHEDEALVFESHPLFPTFIRLRQWDELAKETEVPIVDFEEIRNRARKVLSHS
ncbi:HD domain-containing protein [Chryseolinea lacunae]|uniref:HDIG domain-containing protein n=1 Tax=Chryseolinea lacunae TaxID=2801331 RepID=A0ABS1L1W5_9BACT|nr:HD domain-containing protein [Chryseolinea lacunae]MBL0744516.1 HDIG domain-containing protein [Chryseolinea lacunae]